MRKMRSAGRASRRRSTSRELQFRILNRNWRCADGEIDIVAVERHTLLFCEVKTRQERDSAHRLDAVGQAKRRRLRRLAALWLAAHGSAHLISIDVLGLLRDGADGFTIEHVEGWARPLARSSRLRWLGSRAT